MSRSLCLLSALVLLAFAGCGDESSDQPAVAGSTADTATEAEPTEAETPEPEAEADLPDAEPKSIAQGQLPDDERAYEDHSELTEADAIGTIEHYFYGPYDLETCELLTPAFLRRSYGDMDGCVLGAGELATKITVTPGKVAESEATGFEVDAEGSVYTGEKVTVDLVAGPNGWLISNLSVDAPVGP